MKSEGNQNTQWELGHIDDTNTSTKLATETMQEHSFTPQWVLRADFCNIFFMAPFRVLLDVLADTGRPITSTLHQAQLFKQKAELETKRLRSNSSLPSASLHQGP